MKDPIPLTNEEIIDNISWATIIFCRGFEIPEYALEEFKKFPLPARFVIMSVLLNSLGLAQEKKDPESSRSNIIQANNCITVLRLLLVKTDETLLDKYWDHWASIGKDWWDFIVFKEDLH